MKKILFAICLLFTSTAFAQYYSGGASRSYEPSIPSSPSHAAHADYASMSTEHSILASASYSSAQGERPASDFPQPEGVSLGMVARELRKQHEQAKKSRVVWVNQ